MMHKLYKSPDENPNHVYIMLIILMILTQDNTFNTTINKLVNKILKNLTLLEPPQSVMV